MPNLAGIRGNHSIDHHGRELRRMTSEICDTSLAGDACEISSFGEEIATQVMQSLASRIPLTALTDEN